MKINNHTLKFKTKKFMDFIDITDKVNDLIKKDKIKKKELLNLNS